MKDDIIEVVQEITKSCLVLGSVWFTFYFLDKVCFGEIPEENQNHVNLVLGALISMVIGKILIETALKNVLRRKKR